MSEHDEFDRVASWTVDAVERLGHDYGVPGACRGSGGPGALTWLANWLFDAPQGPFLDQGGGLGGPGGWLTEHHGVRPAVAEPMHGAASGARRLFGLDAVQADGAALPFADGTFGSAWCLGVLSTTTDPIALLTETVRVLRPEGRFGLVVYLSVGDRAVEEPEGNHFPTRAELDQILNRARLTPIERISIDDLPTADPDWDVRADAVADEVARHHRDDPAWRRAQEGEDQVARLLHQRRVAGTVIRATR